VVGELDVVVGLVDEVLDAVVGPPPHPARPSDTAAIANAHR
jgi:hypothetical protein